jgi:hypothetical protein
MMTEVMVVTAGGIDGIFLLLNLFFPHLILLRQNPFSLLNLEFSNYGNNRTKY